MLTYDNEQLEYFSLTLAGEARGEHRPFQFAVADVIMQRWRLAQAGRAWRRAKDIRDIVTWPRQFSCWNENDSNYFWIKQAQAGKMAVKDAEALRQCQWIAEGFLRDMWRNEEEISKADHYHTLPIGKSPRWADQRKLVKSIVIRSGKALFYQLIRD